MQDGRGVFAVQGMGVSVTPTRADGFLTTPEAARMVGVKPVTIRKWRRLGRIVEQGTDEKGYPLYTREAVRAAEREVRENGLAWSGIDPRQVRLSALKRAA
jgi:transposase-like protein